MSELKAYHCIEWHNEYTEFYLKSEADEVIAKLNAEIKRLMDWNKKETQCHLDIERHSKYHRCLGMAMYCHNQREIYERDSYDWELEDDAKDTLRSKAKIMRKWRRRWLEIAEQFKEDSNNG